MGKVRQQFGYLLQTIIVLLAAFPASLQTAASPIQWARYTTANGLPSNRVLCVVTDKDNLWAGTDNGLVLISNGRIQKIFTTKDGLTGRVVTALSLDRNTGDLWVAMYGGVSHYSAGTFQSYTSLTSGLANDVVYDIVVQDNFVWAATAAGLSRLDIRSGSWTTFDSRNTAMTDPWPVRITINKDRAYIATWGSGILEYSIAKNKWTPHLLNQTDGADEGARYPEQSPDFVNALAYDGNSETLWIANRNGLLRQDEHSVRHYCADESGLAFGYINAIRLHGDKLWSCTNHGLKVLNTKTSQWNTYSIVPSFEPAKGASFRSSNTRSNHTMPGGQVFDVAFQGDEIWVASEAGLSLGRRESQPGRPEIVSGDGLSIQSHGQLRDATKAPAKGDGYSEDKNTVNIGFFGPLDNSPDTPRGLAMLHGAQLAIDEANDRAGHQNGPHKSRWTYALKIHSDTAQWGTDTLEPVKMALDEHVVAVLGSIDGSATHTLLRVSSELGFPVMNTATSDPTIRVTGSQWLMSLLPDDRQQSHALARYILGQVKMQKLGILREDARYAHIGTEVFRNEIERNRTIQIVEATFQPGDTDFSQQLRQFKNAGIDGLLLWCQSAEGALILRQLRAAGMRIPAFGPSELATPQLISLAGASTEGFVAVSVFNPARKDREFAEFQQRYRQRFDESPDGYASYAYDGMHLLIAAIEKAGPDRQRVMDTLRAYKSHTREGIADKLIFDEQLNNVASPMMARVEGGRFVYWSPAQVP
jgi:ABC-type branched-subunit amino acid transport system substrate-binding protein